MEKNERRERRKRISSSHQTVPPKTFPPQQQLRRCLFLSHLSSPLPASEIPPPQPKVPQYLKKWRRNREQTPSPTTHSRAIPHPQRRSARKERDRDANCTCAMHGPPQNPLGGGEKRQRRCFCCGFGSFSCPSPPARQSSSALKERGGLLPIPLFSCTSPS